MRSALLRIVPGFVVLAVLVAALSSAPAHAAESKVTVTLVRWPYT